MQFIFRAPIYNIYCSKLSVYLLTSQLLEQDQFTCIEKIKTTGSTYMAASGLTETSNFSDLRHVNAVVDYAFEMRRQLECVNQHSWNNFKMKIGRLLFLLKLFCYFPMFSALAECYLYHNIQYTYTNYFRSSIVDDDDVNNFSDFMICTTRCRGG